MTPVCFRRLLAQRSLSSQRAILGTAQSDAASSLALSLSSQLKLGDSNTLQCGMQENMLTFQRQGRYFTTKDEAEDGISSGATREEEDDVFGVNYMDGKDGIGPLDALPPKYKRDPTTGLMTGDIEAELSEQDRKLLQSDPMEQDKMILDRLEKHWLDEDGDIDDLSYPNELNKLGQRVREAKIALGTVGRSVEAQTTKEVTEDGEEMVTDGLSQRLTRQEFESFKTYMKNQHGVEISEEDLPVMDSDTPSQISDADSRERSTKWMTTLAQRQMDDSVDDNPFSDLMPADLSPARLVNRKNAKKIPRELLHHNNIPLLLSFLTPTGQIQSRVQTRLGARDQRKIAKLVRRARALGLIPYSGQFNAEQHGWKHAPDINEKRPWEAEMERRGLVIQRKRTIAFDELQPVLTGKVKE